MRCAREQVSSARVRTRPRVHMGRILGVTARAFVENDFHRALKLGGPDFFGRQYVAWYETRNLRMVSNIRAAMANHPGARVLNVVGASHKVHYEAYLDQLSDVQLVDPVDVLGE